MTSNMETAWQSKTAIEGGENLVTSLCLQIDLALERLVPVGSSCALIDFPNYQNPGDSAIWCGQREALSRRRVRIVYACDVVNYSQDLLSASLEKDSIILMQGGGNFGDIWGDHQPLREEVIAAFPGNRIVMLPQSICFRQDENLSRARAIFNAHPQLTLMVREKQSLDFALSEFQVPVVLCPDSAFALRELRLQAPVSEEIIWLARTDLESLGRPLPALDSRVQLVDWPEEGERFSRLAKSLTGQAQPLRRWWWQLYPFKLRTYDWLARLRLERACRTLSRARVVVTDRLHGHVLCLLMGIPHVLLDNSYGKIRSLFETWTSGSRLVRWAESPQEALQLAMALLKSTS